MNTFFDIASIAFSVLGYPISYIELAGTLFGLISVFYATKTNILTWPTGILNEIFLFLLFYQVQLYADMLLQVYFFVVTLYGWYRWNNQSIENKISFMSFQSRIGGFFALVICSVIAGILISNIHLYLPQYFKIPAAYPFIDASIMVISIFATVLLAQKKVETWYLWILVDIICTILYLKKAVLFLSLEYFIFLGLASYGLYHWNKQLRHD